MHFFGGFMATQKPRITVTLNDNQHSLLRELSELQSVSMSSLVVELIESVEPVLERLVSILKAAKAAPDSVRQEIKRNAQAAEQSFIPLASQLMGQLESLMPDVTPQDAPRRAGGVTLELSETFRPPTSNRGVRITNTVSKSRSSLPSKSLDLVGKK
jgi:hypothetical protein